MANIETIGVVGAGQMGAGIAQVAAQSGYQVLLLDASAELATKGRERIGKGLARLVDKGKIDGGGREATLGRISVGGDYGDLSGADLIVEAATEKFDLKRKIFERLDDAAKDSALLASNTSSISITKIAAATRRPASVIGMHFMNPVPIMKLVEVVRAEQTSDATYDAVRAAAEQMGKTVITTKDMPGFIVNRILIPFLNEACFALQEGLGTVEDIDAGATLGLNHPMGPFKLADLIGLDTVLSIAEVLHSEFGDDKYRPPVMLRNYVAAGWLGRKSGRGFYTYDK